MTIDQTKTRIWALCLLLSAAGCGQNQSVTPDSGATSDQSTQALPDSTVAVDASLADVSTHTTDAQPPGADKGMLPNIKDVTPPTVSLTATPKTVTAPGNITVSVTASDNVGVVEVELVINNTSAAIQTAAPYGGVIDITADDNGTYNIWARAKDAAGNTSKSATVTVVVNIQAPVPTVVAAGNATLITNTTALQLGKPAGTQAGDFLLALVNADEGSGPRTLATPSGWTLLGGYPIHNLSTAHPPYIISASQSHGTWVFYKFVAANEAAAHTFTFGSATTARGVMITYRGVDSAAPIHDKAGFGLYGDGDTNGFGLGTTSLSAAREVNLIATAKTEMATYTKVKTDQSTQERLNTGEQPNGLNLIIHDRTTSVTGMYLGAQIDNYQSPSALPAHFLFSATTLVLKPK